MKLRTVALFLIAASAPMPGVCEPQTWDERFGKAMQLLEGGRARQALKRFSELNEDSPDTCVDCLLAMASAQIRLGSFSAVESSAQSVIDATENQQALIAAYSFLGFSHYLRPLSRRESQFHIRRSIEPFRRAYELDGGANETVRWNLASALEWVGGMEEAARLFNDPRSRVPRDGAESAMAVTGDVAKPTKISDVQPLVSELARQSRIQGVVILQTIIDKQGNVTDIDLVKGLAGCTAQAITAVRQWKYEPATLNGEPVAVHLTLSVNFKLAR